MVIALVIGLLAVGAAVLAKSSPSTLNQGTRAVIVPTGDAARTVIVPPCGTGTNVVSGSVTAIMNAVGTTTVQLPRGEGVRVVLVPRCTSAAGGYAGTSNLPSAAFVPRPGSPLPTIGTASKSSSSEAAAAQAAQFELTVPDGSPIRTIIVTQCVKAKPTEPAEQILGVAGSSTTAVAPPC